MPYKVFFKMLSILSHLLEFFFNRFQKVLAVYIVTSFTFCKWVWKTYFNFIEPSLMKTHTEKVIGQWKLLKKLIKVKNFHFCSLFVVNFRDPFLFGICVFDNIHILKKMEKSKVVISLFLSLKAIFVRNNSNYSAPACVIDLFCKSFIDCCNLLVLSL